MTISQINESDMLGCASLTPTYNNRYTTHHVVVQIEFTATPNRAGNKAAVKSSFEGDNHRDNPTVNMHGRGCKCFAY
jgi:hypothetical protein